MWHRLPLEDGTQVLGLPPASKYGVSSEQVAAALSGICKAPLVASRNLYLQFLFAWLTGNGDLHAKNLAVLAVPAASSWPPCTTFRAPCYTGTRPWRCRSGQNQESEGQALGGVRGHAGAAAACRGGANRTALSAAGAIRLEELPFGGSPLRGTQRELRFRVRSLVPEPRISQGCGPCCGVLQRAEFRDFEGLGFSNACDWRNCMPVSTPVGTRAASRLDRPGMMACGCGAAGRLRRHRIRHPWGGVPRGPALDPVRNRRHPLAGAGQPPFYTVGQAAVPSTAGIRRPAAGGHGGCDGLRLRLRRRTAAPTTVAVQPAASAAGTAPPTSTLEPALRQTLPHRRRPRPPRGLYGGQPRGTRWAAEGGRRRSGGRRLSGPNRRRAEQHHRGNGDCDLGVALIDVMAGDVHEYGVRSKFTAASTGKVMAAAAYYRLTEAGARCR